MNNSENILEMSEISISMTDNFERQLIEMSEFSISITILSRKQNWLIQSTAVDPKTITCTFTVNEHCIWY